MSCDPFADLIDLILLMHSICTPTAIIAARSHAPESVVKHVIEFGELPDVELGPPWQRDAVLFAVSANTDHGLARELDPEVVVQAEPKLDACAVEDDQLAAAAGH